MRIAVVDIGGTCIKSGIWEDDSIGEIRETDTGAGRGGVYVMQTVVEILSGYRDFQAIGISTTGQVDTDKGRIFVCQSQYAKIHGDGHKRNRRAGVPCSCGGVK